MARIRISLIGELYDCVKPLFDATIRPEGVELAVTRLPSPEAMRRQLTAWEFDICEMAFGAYLIARAQGADVTAIPVFPRRAFFHTHFMCHPGAGIDGPRDLAHKRIGVAEYVQSATVWARGILEHDFGMDSRKTQWYVERAGSRSTGEVLGFKPPHDLSLHQTPGGKSLVAMLAAGALDMALVGENAQAQAGHVLRPLFADAIAEGRRFHDAHGYVPANHTYMVRGSLAREHPALLANIYRAFCESKMLARQSLPHERPQGLLFGNERLARSCESFPGDPFAYGIGANQPMLEAIVALCQEQVLIGEKPSIRELFVPGTE
ncbi:MAG: ABC transporter substrate-binding protein [Burkholderiales bacterium]